MKLTSFHYLIFFFVIAVGGLVAARIWGESQPSELDSFAQCLNDSGAKFYGAFWCPHCADQKAMFGNAVQYIPYVECSTPDGQNQLQVCIDKEVTSYPTWILEDGTRLGGVQQLDELAAATNCALPE